MGIEKLLNNQNSSNPDSSKLSILKIIGLGGLVTSLLGYPVSFIDNDLEPKHFLLTGLISAGVYITGIIAEYFTIKKSRNIKNYKRAFEYEKEAEQENILFNEMLKTFPCFQDQKFLEKYPGIEEVAYHIYSEIKGIELKGGKLLQIWNRFPLFYEMEITKFPQYLYLLKKGNPKVVENYRQIKEKVCN